MKRQMRSEAALWFLVGAAGGVVGPAGISGLLWLGLTNVMPLIAFIAPIGLVGLAVVVRRRGGPVAARAWAAISWFVACGALLVEGLDFLADRLPMAPLSPLEVAVFSAAWSAGTGTIAALLFVVGRHLARGQIGFDLQPREPTS